MYINLCRHLLIRLIILIYFACTYNRFCRFFIYFVVFRYILLTNPCHLPIHAAWNSWNVIHEMCLFLTRTSLAAAFFFFFHLQSFFKKAEFKSQNYLSDSWSKYNTVEALISGHHWCNNFCPLIRAALFFGTRPILKHVQSNSYLILVLTLK